MLVQQVNVDAAWRRLVNLPLQAVGQCDFLVFFTFVRLLFCLQNLPVNAASPEALLQVMRCTCPGKSSFGTPGMLPVAPSHGNHAAVHSTLYCGSRTVKMCAARCQKLGSAHCTWLRHAAAQPSVADYAGSMPHKRTTAPWLAPFKFPGQGQLYSSVVGALRIC